ncbi:hypothetical protein BH09BAC2_BH09BAC2_17760 [soil metagenome]
MISYRTVTTVSQRHLRRKTITFFIILCLFFTSIFFTWRWLHHQPISNEAPIPVRKMLNFNEAFFRNFFEPHHLAKTFPREAAVRNVRVNGKIGLKEVFDTALWKLQVIRSAGDTLSLSLNDIKALPKTEIIFDFKCIEGWSQVTHWSGVKFSDLIKKYNLNNQSMLKYVSLVTPDKNYYVGIDMESMLHPQTLLCYEVNDAPLPLDQGYPLRLIIPVKYGIKHLKRIGTISFSNERPADYWYERGYDYYSGL